jgi:hypothetical protein
VVRWWSRHRACSRHYRGRKEKGEEAEMKGYGPDRAAGRRGEDGPEGEIGPG